MNQLAVLVLYALFLHHCKFISYVDFFSGENKLIELKFTLNILRIICFYFSSRYINNLFLFAKISYKGNFEHTSYYNG